MKIPKFFAVTLLVSLTCSYGGSPEVMAPEPGPYTLFNPTPRDRMRPFTTDQTTFTLNPYTVDAGHFQVEADIADYIYDKESIPGGNVKTHGWIFGWSTLRIGLCDRADLEISIRAYRSITIRDSTTGAKARITGFGDLTLSSKINIWGNDGGQTALAIVPSVSFPTSEGNDQYTGGIRVPFLANLPWEVQLGLMTGFDLYETSGNVHADFTNSISLRRELYGPVQGYIEFVSVVSEETDAWEGFVNGGITYQVTRDLQLHTGITVEAHNSVDYNPYVGFSWRY